MYVSDHHKKFDTIPTFRMYEEINSEENKKYLLHILIRIYACEVKEGSSIIGQLDEKINALTSCYDFVPPCKRSGRELMSFINSSIVLRIVETMPRQKETYDPMWVNKGPTFRIDTIDHDMNPGKRLPIKMGLFGPVEIDCVNRGWRRTRSSSDYRR